MLRPIKWEALTLRCSFQNLLRTSNTVSIEEGTRMRNYIEDFHTNIKFIELLMKPLRQRVWNTDNPSSIIGWIIHIWPIWYISMWVLIYVYFILAQRAGLVTASEQIWCLMSITQILAKLINGVLKKESLRKLMQWCEVTYSTQYKDKYRNIIHEIFENTNIYIYLCIRWVHVPRPSYTNNYNHNFPSE